MSQDANIVGALERGSVWVANRRAEAAAGVVVVIEGADMSACWVVVHLRRVIALDEPSAPPQSMVAGVFLTAYARLR